jgi:hypothetical protein
MLDSEFAKELPQQAERALRHLLLIDDQTAKARDRFNAAQVLKQYLHGLENLLKSRQTTPDLHKKITEVLRQYWQS